MEKEGDAEKEKERVYRDDECEMAAIKAASADDSHLAIHNGYGVYHYCFSFEEHKDACACIYYAQRAGQY